MPRQKVDEKTIIKEALKLFRQKSYHATSMADIAMACGLLKGSLYHYFHSNKNVVLLHVSFTYFELFHFVIIFCILSQNRPTIEVTS